MASSSSSSPRTWIYNVFPSFHGPDARNNFLCHLRKQFRFNGIKMYDDQEMERGETIGPALIQAINASRISIVVLSKYYASSSWCLDELLEILKCKETIGQIVMTVFYGVDPSDVRNKTGDFGIAFNKTCARKMDEEKRQKWSQALNAVGKIAGEHFQNWDNEADKIEKIAKDVSNKLNATPSRDFGGMVGLEAHLRRMKSLLDLDYNGVKMVGITGPAGIGKTTIARALQSRFSTRFKHTCFVDNLRGSYHSGIDDHGLQLALQQQLFSKLFNQDGMLCHLGVLPQRLIYLNAFIIFDDVNDVKQLDALAKEPTWFGPGSRIVVTTEKKDLLQQHGINNTYHVRFPSGEEALEILCRYAFKQNSPPHGFKQLAERTTELCGRLPLALRVVGSSLRNNKNKAEWEAVLNGREINRGIKDVLRVGYDCLYKGEKKLFLQIAVFFNGRDSDLVKAMFSDSDLDVIRGLKILEHRSLIEISTYGENIVMHRLLQQLGQQMIEELRKHGVLIHASEICDVLEHAEGTRAVSGISFDTSGITELSISKKAFIRMPNLQFLRVYKSKNDGNDILNIPEEMELPCRLRLLHWQAFPSKCLPPRFHPEYLVELIMHDSKLEKLWDGSQALTSLKSMKLSGSLHLKELPDLSKATNLEYLDLNACTSLVELPSSYSNLQKLHTLWMNGCLKLKVIPPNCNLTSLDYVWMERCSQLANFPCISENIVKLVIADTAVEEVPTSITRWSHLVHLQISGNEKLKTLPQLPMNITKLFLSDNGFISISECCIEGLRWLRYFIISGCRKLTSLPEIPSSIQYLDADDCESLKTVSFALDVDIERERYRESLKTVSSDLDFDIEGELDRESLETVSYDSEDEQDSKINFANCFKLDEEARRAIIQDSFITGRAILPGRRVPAEFNHRAMGNTLSFTLSAFSSFKVCLVISPYELTREDEFTREHEFIAIQCRRIRKGYEYPVKYIYFHTRPFQTKHLCVFHYEWLDKYMWKVSREIMVEFSSIDDIDIIECGAQILTYKSDDFDVYAFDTEDDEEDYKSKSGEAHKDEGEGIAEGDYESVSRKTRMSVDLKGDEPGKKKQKT